VKKFRILHSLTSFHHCLLCKFYAFITLVGRLNFREVAHKLEHVFWVKIV
jgi:hypothetical protein